MSDIGGLYQRSRSMLILTWLPNRTESTSSILVNSSFLSKLVSISQGFAIFRCEALSVDERSSPGRSTQAVEEAASQCHRDWEQATNREHCICFEAIVLWLIPMQACISCDARKHSCSYTPQYGKPCGLGGVRPSADWPTSSHGTIYDLEQTIC